MSNRIGYLEARTKKLRCTCGHSRSSHRQAAHLHHELGACRGMLPAVTLDDGAVIERPCRCRQYEPKAEEAA